MINAESPGKIWGFGFRDMEEHLVKYVHPTGFWYKDMAIYLHLDSVELKDWLINFLRDYQDKMIYDLGCGTGY